MHVKKIHEPKSSRKVWSQKCVVLCDVSGTGQSVGVAHHCHTENLENLAQWLFCRVTIYRYSGKESVAHVGFEG